MAKQKYYVVWEGKKPGVYNTWAECKAQTDHFTGAKYKSYESRSAAEEAYRAGWKGNWGQARVEQVLLPKANRSAAAEAQGWRHQKKWTMTVFRLTWAHAEIRDL